MKKDWLMDIFGCQKPIIGVVHLLALPGSPRNNSQLVDIVSRAKKDAMAYEEGGANGIIVENYGDVPFNPNRVGPETIAFMTRLASEVAHTIRIPMGINVLRNDGLAALAIATATGARYVRVNVLTEAMVTDQGIIQSIAYEMLRYRRFLEAENIKVLADVHVKHATPLLSRPIETAAKDTVERGLADAVIITGEATGVSPDFEKVKKVVDVLNGTPVLVGSGATALNVRQYLEVCDGIIVGTSLKQNGRVENEVDLKRVQQFITNAKKVEK